MIDLHWINQLLLAVASAVVATCTPVLVVYLEKHFKIARNSALSALLDDAITGGGRVALAALGSLAAHNPSIDLQYPAIAKGAEHALTVAKPAMDMLGITKETVAAMVAGELAKLLGVAAVEPGLPAIKPPV